MKKTEAPAANVSFLHEFQLEGKANGKMALGDWESALNDLTKIRVDEASAALKATAPEEWPTSRMATYCHDCRLIVPPELKSFGRRSRAVCGNCGSKKISSGREDALKSFYHLDEETEARNREAAAKRPKQEWNPKQRHPQSSSRPKKRR
jgi:hypothetical protein